METIKLIGNGLLWALLVGLFAACSSTGPQHSRSSEELTQRPEAIPTGEPPSRYGNPESYVVFGKRYYVKPTSKGYRERGIASWYGDDFHGKRTSSGVPYDMYAITAAHKSLPIPTYVRVTNLENDRSIVVKVNDRGPFVDDRIIDLSYTAATQLGMVDKGTAQVEVTALPPYQHLPGFGPDGAERLLAANMASTDSSASQAFVQASYQPLAVNKPIYRSVAVRPSVPMEKSAALYLQIGAFSDPRNAERLRSQLVSQLDRDVRIDFDRDNLHKVRVGPLNDASEAERLALRLTSLGIDNPQVIAD